MSYLKEIKAAIGDNISLTPALCTFLNPFSYMKLRGRQTIGHFKLYADGIFLVWMLRLIGVRVARVSFDMTSAAPVIFAACAREQKRVFLVGSRDEEVAAASETFCRLYPGLKIAGVRSGYFKDEERAVFIARLVEMQPEVVVVGMGTPLQEQFLLDLRAAGWVGTGFTCGGFFHQTARRGERYYPDFFNRMNLRFLYRIIDEPKLIRRYLLDYPWFILVFIFDVFSMGS